jgi:hypothetical protein
MPKSVTFGTSPSPVSASRTLAGCQQDVGGLEVAVHQVVVVRQRHTRQDAAEDVLGVLVAEAVPCQCVVEARAVDVLHEQAGRAVDVEHVEDTHDVAVPDQRLDPALLQRAPADARADEPEHLECVHRAEVAVAHPVHGGGPAAADDAVHHVAIDRIARLQRATVVGSAWLVHVGHQAEGPRTDAEYTASPGAGRASTGQRGSACLGLSPRCGTAHEGASNVTITRRNRRSAGSCPRRRRSHRR